VPTDPQRDLAAFTDEPTRPRSRLARGPVCPLCDRPLHGPDAPPGGLSVQRPLGFGVYGGPGYIVHNACDPDAAH
jgi:hypothetical protein